MKYDKNQYNTFDGDIIKMIISIFKRKEKLFTLLLLLFFFNFPNQSYILINLFP